MEEPKVEPESGDVIAPPSAQSIIGVSRDGGDTNIAVAYHLYPPPLSEALYTLRSTNLNDGLPVVVIGDNIWIGAPVRPNGALGGLWRSRDLGETWEGPDVSGNVSSLLADIRRGALMVATAPGYFNSGRRADNYEARQQRLDYETGELTSHEGAPHTSESIVQYCGILDDGTEVTRVDRNVYLSGPYSLLRMWLDR